MKPLRYALTVSLFLALSACSLSPKYEISFSDLQRSKGFTYYIIEEDPDGVIKVLNSRGEAVVRAEYFDSPVYLQIFATSQGLAIRHFDRDEYDFPEE